jgi:transcriptional repressor NrdR
MFCPRCRHKDTKVVDSRMSAGGVAIRRRRECLRKRCVFRFSTIEEVAILDMTVIKRDGRREPYSREKLMGGLKKAFERRPITTEELQKLVSAIERDLQILRKPEIRSTQIGEIVLRHMRRIDEVAYVRFVSVYESFDDLQSFRELLSGLEGKKRTATKRKAAKTVKKRK